MVRLTTKISVALTEECSLIGNSLAFFGLHVVRLFSAPDRIGIVKFHYGGLITASVAVVWSRENSDNISVVAPVVAFHDELMGSGDQGEPVGVIE
ncbi:hypothetical protein BpHYR1_001488 [Brachionus plicatilis]|uniref:Uncharacterized protein n=1 Tax=Brachionus plicatilis TaxID=10195 RepID=A0A3M7Q3X0_BRAPC|nr:hypothetical protein BpHYR1_001488 [Brachionus plicatilis]